MSTTQKRWHGLLASDHHLPGSKDAPKTEDQMPWPTCKINGEPNARYGRRYFAAGFTGSC